jgi:hypothetical protein
MSSIHICKTMRTCKAVHSPTKTTCLSRSVSKARGKCAKPRG